MGTAAGVGMGSVIGHGVSNALFGGSGSRAVEQAPEQPQSSFQQEQQPAQCSIQAKGRSDLPPSKSESSQLTWRSILYRLHPVPQRNQQRRLVLPVLSRSTQGMPTNGLPTLEP